MRDSFDVIVVGAGPAGSVAARKAAEAGFDTLLIEKRQEIGVPVRCAEAVGAGATREFIDEDPRWINAHIDYYSISNRQGVMVVVPPTEPTWVVDRKVFDYELAHLANKAGATVLTSAAATAVLREDGYVSGLTIKRFGKLTDVKAKLVIAADGVESQVARWAGLKTVPPMADFYSGAQYLLGNMAPHMQVNRCEYHVGMDMAPGGYLWVFPKSADTANVGIVISADNAAVVSAREYLDWFVAARFPGASILNVVVGGIPATGALRKMVTDGLMVVGDAAHQADPLTAGGINLGMYGASMAMQVGIEALKTGDVSAQALQPYEALWRERFGKMHAALYQLRKMMTQMNPDTLDGLIRTASTLELDTMTPGAVLMTLLREHPLMLLQARTLITTGLILK